MKQKRISFQPYPFVVLSIALITGILLQDKGAFLPPLIWVTGLIASMALSVIFQFLPSLGSGLAFIRDTILLLSFVCLGGTLCWLRNIQNKASWYGHYKDKAEALVIRLHEAPVEKPRTLLLKAAVQSVNITGKWVPAEGNLLVYVYKKNLRKQFRAGQTLIIPNKLKEIRPSGNPFAFDQKQYANRNGLFHQCFLNGDETIWLPDDPYTSNTISHLRTGIRAGIEKNIKDETTRALVLATIINERADLEPELVNAYSTTGIIHIIAISGMHIILLASIILLTVGKIPIPVINNSKYIWAVVLVWVYIAITGFPPSAVRAAVMFSIFAIGRLLKRDSNQVNTWAASGFLLLCYNPYWIYDVGFQLSYLAVLSLLLFTKSITDWWQPANWLLRNLWQGVAVSISVQVLVFPLVIYYFNQFPLLVFLANIPAGIFSTVLMIGVMIMIVLSNIALPSLWIGDLLTAITKIFHSFVFVLSRYSPEGLRTLRITAPEYWLIMAIIAALCVFLYFRKPGYLIGGLALSILLVVNFISRAYAVLHQERIIVYNTNKESNVSVIKGKRLLHLNACSEKTYQYTLKPAMLGFGIKQTEQDAAAGDVFVINGQRILRLGPGRIEAHRYFPVDVLIVSDHCSFEPEQWLAAFQPERIIIDGSLPVWKAAKWGEALMRAGAKVKWVGDSGAWVYPEDQPFL